MTDKELKKLGRSDLLEMLIERNNEIDSLNEHIQTLEAKVIELNKQIAKRHIDIDKAGSIAEAALVINGIFEDAEKAAAQYIENIKSLSGRQEIICSEQKAKTEADCKRMVLVATEKSQSMLLSAKTRSEELERTTREKCDAMTKQAAMQADEGQLFG